jgi:hypothetical protein
LRRQARLFPVTRRSLPSGKSLPYERIPVRFSCLTDGAHSSCHKRIQIFCGP